MAPTQNWLISNREVLLINGSGLGVNNHISPRAADQCFIALWRMSIPFP